MYVQIYMIYMYVQYIYIYKYDIYAWNYIFTYVFTFPKLSLPWNTTSAQVERFLDSTGGDGSDHALWLDPPEEHHGGWGWNYYGWDRCLMVFNAVLGLRWPNFEAVALPALPWRGLDGCQDRPVASSLGGNLLWGIHHQKKSQKFWRILTWGKTGRFSMD